MSWRDNLLGYPNSRSAAGMTYFHDPPAFVPGLPRYPMIGGLQSMGPPPSQPNAMLPVGATFPPSMGFMRPPGHEANMMGLMRPLGPRYLPGPSEHSSPLYLTNDIAVPPSPSPAVLSGSGINVMSPTVPDIYGGPSSNPLGQMAHSGSLTFDQHTVGTSIRPHILPHNHHPGGVCIPPVPRLASAGATTTRFIPKPPPLMLAPTSRNTPSSSSSNSAGKAPSMSPAPTWHSPMASPSPSMSQQSNASTNAMTKSSKSPTTPVPSWHTPVSPSQPLSPVMTSSHVQPDDRSNLIYRMEDDKYMCNKCNYSSTKFDQILTHISSHTGVLVCHICGKAFIKHSDMTRHIETHSNVIHRGWDPVTGDKITSSGNMSPATLSTSELYGDWPSSKLLSALTQPAVSSPEPIESVFRVLRRKEPSMEASIDTPALHDSPSSARRNSYTENIETNACSKDIINKTAISTSDTLTPLGDSSTRPNGDVSTNSGISGLGVNEFLSKNVDRASDPVRSETVARTLSHSSTSPTDMITTGIGISVAPMTTSLVGRTGYASTPRRSRKSLPNLGSKHKEHSSIDPVHSVNHEANMNTDDVMTELIQNEVGDNSREIARSYMWPELDMLPRQISRRKSLESTLRSSDISKTFRSKHDNFSSQQIDVSHDINSVDPAPPSASHRTATDSEILAALYGGSLKEKRQRKPADSKSLHTVDGSANDDNEEQPHVKHNKMTKVVTVIDGDDDVLCVVTRNGSPTERVPNAGDPSETHTASSQRHASLESSSASSLPQLPDTSDNRDDGLMQIQIHNIRSCAGSSVTVAATGPNSEDTAGNDENQPSTEADSNHEPIISLPEYTSIEGNIVDLAAGIPKPVSYPIQNISMISPSIEQSLPVTNVSPQTHDADIGNNSFSPSKPRAGHGFRCHICNYEGRTERSLRKHIRAHSSSYKICQYCKKAFERPSDLARHEERHERNMQKTGGDPSLISKGQVLGVNGPDGFVAYQVPDEKYRCKKCNFVTNRFHKLALHNRQKHSVKYNCKYCPMVFISPLPLGNHMKRCPMKPLDADPSPLVKTIPDNYREREKMFVDSQEHNDRTVTRMTIPGASPIPQSSPGMRLPTTRLATPNQVHRNSSGMGDLSAASGSHGIARLDCFTKDILLKSNLLEVTIGDENELVLSCGEIDNSVFETSTGDIPLCSDYNEAKMIIANHIQLYAQSNISSETLDAREPLYNEQGDILKVPSPFALIPTGPPPDAITSTSRFIYRTSPTTIPDLAMRLSDVSFESSRTTSMSLHASNLSSGSSVNISQHNPILSAALFSQQSTDRDHDTRFSANVTPMPVDINAQVTDAEPTYAMSESTDSNSEPIDTMPQTIEFLPDTVNASTVVTDVVTSVSSDDIPETTHDYQEPVIGSDLEIRRSKPFVIRPQSSKNPKEDTIRSKITIMETERTNTVMPVASSLQPIPVSLVQNTSISSHWSMIPSVVPTSVTTVQPPSEITTSSPKQNVVIISKNHGVPASIPCILQSPTADGLPLKPSRRVSKKRCDVSTPVYVEIKDTHRKKKKTIVFVPSAPKRLMQACVDYKVPEVVRSTSVSPTNEGIRMYPSPPPSPLSGSETQIMRPNAVRHKVARFYCKRCNYGTDAKPKMEEHMRAHTGRFICKHCDKACIKASDLYRHWVTHNLTNDKDEYICDTCDFTSLSKDVVMNHLRIHYLIKQTPFPQSHNITKCGLCGKSFTRSQLFVHKKIVHSNKAASITSAAASVRNARGWSNRPKSTSVAESEKCYQFSCPDCNAFFSSDKELSNHYTSSHCESDIGSPKTPECQDTVSTTSSPGGSTSPTAATSTDKVSEGVECSYCRRKFKSKRHLIGHERIHSSSHRRRANAMGKSKPLHGRYFQCQHCRKRFKSRYYLVQHVKLHTGEKPFQCLKCGERFTLSQACQNHTRRGCPARRERHHVMVSSAADNDNDDDCILIDSIPPPIIEIVND